jgi:two-component system phosphate regulon sensor histidine kinase PhoR
VRKRRLVTSLFLSYLWVAAIAVVLVGVYGARTVRESYLDRTAEDLEARARLAQRPIGRLLDEGKTSGADGTRRVPATAIDAVCKELGSATGCRFTVILPSGQVIGDTREDPAHMDNHADRPEIRDAMAGSVGRSTRFSATLKQELMYVAVPVELRPEAGGDGSLMGVVRSSIPVTDIRETLGAIHRRILLAALVVAGVLALVSVWLAVRISRPLEELKAGAERFAEGKLDHRLPESSFEEINVLTEAMNRMAGQLHQRIRTIQRQQNELEAVLSSMEEAVLAVDNDGVIINVNETCAELLGSEPDRLRGRLIHEVVRKPDLLEFVEASLETSSPLERDIQIRGQDDRWLNAHGTALYDAQQQRIGALVVLHDVTRLRRLENVRRDFVANVSHELKTPITSIRGFVETLIDGAIDDKVNASRFLRIIARQVNRLDAIIEDLLTLSRLEKGPDELAGRLVPGSVARVLQAAVEMCEKKAADKGVHLQWECDKALTVPMSGPLLEQAVVNLVDNAIKYSDPGGEVRVTGEADEEGVTIRVRDGGCGIEPKHLPRLFERFYRVDKARSRELGGTGLGLAIVKHITLVHRGSIHVESEVEQGTTFTLRLPAASPALAAAADPSG